MKVAIDATPLTLSSGGIARYTRELSRALAEQFPEDEYFLVSDQPFEMPRPGPGNLRRGAGPCGWLARRWWLYGLPRELSRTGADVFHGTNFVTPWLPLHPSVVTVHDLSPWLDPAWQRDAAFVRRRAPYVLGLSLATMIVTPSEAVRRQVMERFRVPPARVRAVPLAASAHFRPVAGPHRTAPYFLYAGVLEPRKNLEMLLGAWRVAYRKCGVELVLAGRARADFSPPAPQPGLHVIGEVPEEDLPGWHSGAVACLYPSLYEGFGLPVLEAMQCGALVIASRDPAVSEVAGDAAVLLDARDPGSWVAAMNAAALHPEQLELLRAKALQRAKLFSWERTARLTRDVYLEAVRCFGG